MCYDLRVEKYIKHLEDEVSELEGHVVFIESNAKRRRERESDQISSENWSFKKINSFLALRLDFVYVYLFISLGGKEYYHLNTYKSFIR